jgi:hypothetical protein
MEYNSNIYRSKSIHAPNMIINREAADKTKGFRLQKMRVLEYMLDGIASCEKPMFYSSIEHIEDVYVKDRANDGKEVLEENKNYNPDSRFTFNSHEVVNTLVSFIDIWFKNLFSDNLKLSFYSTNNFAKEGKSKVTKDNSITLPDKAILELLIDKDYDYSNLLPSVKLFVIAEYEKQYSNPKHPGRIDVIKKMDDSQWKKFLSCIDWKFGEPDEVIKKKEVIDKIRSCKHFSTSHANKEELIFSELMELYDERQNLKDPTEKFIHSSEIEVVFHRSGSGATRLILDPVWEIWSKIPKSDSRNIRDKIVSVCADYSEKKINQHALKVTRSMIEQSSFASDKSLLSLKYRVFEHCQDFLIKYFEAKQNENALSEQEIDSLLSSLNAEANTVIHSLSTNFTYTHNNQRLIDGLILELFDSCYLAFD